MLKILEGHGRGDAPGLKFRGCYLHDPNRPLEEARENVALLRDESPSLVLVFGLGLGYHLQALKERWPGADVVVFEPEVELRDMYQRHCLQAGPESPRPRVVSGWRELDEVLTREVVHGRHPEPAVFIAPGYDLLLPRAVENFKGNVLAARLRRAVDIKTRREKGRLFLEHLAANTRALLETPLLTGLKGKMPRRPGFLVGSGPGLGKNGRWLREIQDRALILAGSSALKPLLEMGVRPDAVTVIEAEDTSRFFRLPDVPAGCVLSLASASHPAHFQVPGYRRSAFHLSPGAACLFGSEDFVPQAGTSGSAAFTLGLLLGLDPLVLVGQDQAFDHGRVHAAGTPGDEPIRNRAALFTVTGLDG
ncbi:MAG: 6-hydroxymethylpterin diphosphokinase MptE-like protein, partial [Thermodesulfobacteriota bacterium]